MLKKLLTTLIFSFCFLCQAAFCQTLNSFPIIQLKTGDVSALPNAAQWIDSITKLKSQTDPVEVLLHFKTMPDSRMKDQLRKQGIALFDYIPDNTYLAHVSPTVSKEAFAMLPITTVLNVLPAMKAGDYLWQQVRSKKGGIEVLVSFYPGIDAAAIRQFVAAMGASINVGSMQKYVSYKITVPSEKVKAMASWYGVKYISPVTDMVPLDIMSMPSMKGNVAASPSMYGGYGLNGDSVTVGVGDNSSGIYHIDTKEKTTNFNPGPKSAHGQITNGIVGSSSIVDPFAATTTPNVKLLDHLYDNVLTATGAMYNGYDMTLSNNSYTITTGTCTYAGTYDVYSAFLDTLSWEYPFVQHVFASGNDGGLNCSPYLNGFANVGGGYQPSKNIIVVGSMTSFLQQAGDESRGPVKDGRLKPEIIAVGLGTYSTVPDDKYAWTAGTSMAAPHVTGGLAALSQRYKQLNGGNKPRADLLKAILLNGAMDLGNPGPDYSYGYGGMDLYRSLQMLDANNYTYNTIAEGDSQFFTITIPPSTGKLKVMICWNDFPASPLATKALVNDLDLTIIDPASEVHLPLGLDPTPANVNNIATEKEDHINNTEQVTIINPVAGSYIIKVKGHSVPFGPQGVAIVYDIIPAALYLTGPLGGEQFPNMTGDTIRMYWEGIDDGHRLTAQFSSDSGHSWILISDTIHIDAHYVGYLPLDLNSGKCFMRLSKNGTSEVVSTQRFSVSTEPTISFDTAQCPSYLNIHWSPAPRATGYYILLKKGAALQIIDSVTDTTYTFSGLPLHTKTYVAVQPILDGFPGFRSWAAIKVADSGNCTKAVSNGDLMVEKVVSPTNGRMYTKTDLTGITSLQVLLRNMYRNPCSNYTISWKVNGGTWNTINTPVALPANGTAVATIPGMSFPDFGSYTIVIAINNNSLPDPQHINDTLIYTIQSIPNDPIYLAAGFTDDFEDMGRLSVSRDSIGVSPGGHWDFFNSNDSGRLRAYVSDDITISGSHSISMDVTENLRQGSKNTFVGTFNLNNYDTSTAEVRVDFDYVLHAIPKTGDGNLVMARGVDTASWVPLFNYDLTGYQGFIKHVKSVSVTDALRLERRNFSTSTQISFGQNDTSLIASTNYGNGMTMDNFKIYTVDNDASMVNVVYPLPTNCGLPASVPLIVKVRNGVNYTLHNIQLYYSLDGGPAYTGLIDSIKAKTSVDYTFSQQMNITPGISHSINVWLVGAGDSYIANDSILNYHIRNSPIYGSFPYLENFESGDGGYFSDGFRNSWHYGVPVSPIINSAASGNKIWKTNLNGNYSNLETSYLYSPCFDLSGLSHPMLSFSAAIQTENCGNTLCDAAWVEYSLDGATWIKLGAPGLGTNWYDSTFSVWSNTTLTRWHVASVPVPPSLAGQITHFRFVLTSDPGVTFEGMAIDDIHIYDLAKPICPPADSINAVTLNINGNQWTDFAINGKLMASINPQNNTVKNTSVNLYTGGKITNPGATQYIFGRNYVVSSETRPADSMGVRLYMTDSEFVNTLNDTLYPSCTPLTDAYRLGITQYTNVEANGYYENGTMRDDTGNLFTYYPSKSVTWVPYDKGYYAELKAVPWGEFWFNNGGPTGTFSSGKDYLDFQAYRVGQIASIKWYSLIDTAIDSYYVERSLDNSNFSLVADTLSSKLNPGAYTYPDNVNFTVGSTYYYRLRYKMHGTGNYYYSPIRKVEYADTANNLLSLSAERINSVNAAINWHSPLDIITDRYVLNRAIGNGAYQVIDTRRAVHIADYQNYFDDLLYAMEIKPGTQIHYKVTAYLQDNTPIESPIRTIDWSDANTLVNIFPNPTHNGDFTILWNADHNAKMHINMYDATGRGVYETTAYSNQWVNTTLIQTSGRYRGLYLLRIDINGKKYTSKMVFE